ncbi:MAG TPA: gliding motility protein GldN [Mucilaginibacter sp.]|jgi:gliding motility associated protien GldN|nr:gliding motility protein GldN [Mucilaginibacter sp.]
MKSKFLIVVLCLACVTAVAQTKKKKTPARKAATTKGAKAPVNSKQTSMVDTTKKPTDAPIVADNKPYKPLDIPLDGYYKKTNIMNNKVTPYTSVREADIVFQKRVWEEIDLREKVNAYLASPKARLIDILMDAVAAGELTAYDPIVAKPPFPNFDGFDTPLTPGQARAKMADSTLVNKFDANGEKTGSKMVAGEFQPDSVVKFRIKEDWMFDKQRSVWEPRILWIAPMVKPQVAGLAADYQPAFWIYFPAARQVLVTHEAFNRNNDATDLSFDDVFLKRLFHGYVVKVSNDKDERIKDYAEGIDRLYESDRIKKQLMDWELNLWQY